MSSKDVRVPSLRDAFLIVFLGFTLALAVQFLGFFRPGKWSLLLGTIAMILPALAFSIFRPYSIRTVFRWRMPDVRCLAAGAVIGLGMSPILDEMDRLIQRLLPMSPDILRALESALRFKTVPELILLAFTLVAAAPICEETLFRGVLQGTLERTGDINKAVLSSALLFTAIHFNPWWTVEILITGVLLGVMAWRTNSIFPSVVIHAVNNGLSLIMINTDPAGLRGYVIRDHVAPYWLVLGALMVYAGFKWTYRVTEEMFIK